MNKRSTEKIQKIEQNACVGNLITTSRGRSDPTNKAASDDLSGQSRGMQKITLRNNYKIEKDPQRPPARARHASTPRNARMRRPAHGRYKIQGADPDPYRIAGNSINVQQYRTPTRLQSTARRACNQPDHNNATIPPASARTALHDMPSGAQQDT